MLSIRRLNDAARSWLLRQSPAFSVLPRPRRSSPGGRTRRALATLTQKSSPATVVKHSNRYGSYQHNYAYDDSGVSWTVSPLSLITSECECFVFSSRPVSFAWPQPSVLT